MSDEGIIEVVSALKANDKTMKDNGISDNLWGKAVECIMFLQSENATLHERLEKSMELPSGDRVWFITEDEEGEESYIISKPTDRLTVDELYEIGKKYFTTREAAEAHLAEEEHRAEVAEKVAE